jgi:molecular chaperone GrpE
MHRSQVRSLFGRKKTDDARPESEGDAADAKAAAADAVKGDSEGEETSDSSADESEAAESGYEQEDSGSGEEDSAETISDLEVKVQELDGELQKFRDALARSRADLINLEHMAKKDTEHARNFAIKKFSTDVLGVADAIGEACKSFDTMDKELVENKQISNLISGVKLTEKALIDCFHRNGIEKIPSLGEDFDPNVHEALFQQPNPDFDENIVCHVVVEGYTIHGNTLRPAKVGVSAGRPEKPEGSIEE